MYAEQRCLGEDIYRRCGCRYFVRSAYISKSPPPSSIPSSARKKNQSFPSSSRYRDRAEREQGRNHQLTITFLVRILLGGMISAGQHGTTEHTGTRTEHHATRSTHAAAAASPTDGLLVSGVRPGLVHGVAAVTGPRGVAVPRLGRTPITTIAGTMLRRRHVTSIMTWWRGTVAWPGHRGAVVTCGGSGSTRWGRM